MKMFLLYTLFLLDADARLSRCMPVMSLPAAFILPGVTNWPLLAAETVFILNLVPDLVYFTLSTMNPSPGKTPVIQ